LRTPAESNDSAGVPFFTMLELKGKEPSGLFSCNPCRNASLRLAHKESGFVHSTLRLARTILNYERTKKNNLSSR
ncbi:MAG: hypothetical protein NC241_05870, partial [Bacteroides sp.]|nr:hypothetical protein [Bacteroides sp.]MCM1458478.1 hypothetical protein [Lachnoclostridium sp.]